MPVVTKCRLKADIAAERRRSKTYKAKKIFANLLQGRPTLVPGPAYDMVLPGPPIGTEPPSTNQPATNQAATNQPTVNQPAPSAPPLQLVAAAPVQDQFFATNQELGFSHFFSRGVADAGSMTSLRRAAFLPGDLTANQELGFTYMFSRDVADADTMTSLRRAAFLPGDLDTEVPSAEREAAAVVEAEPVELPFAGIERWRVDVAAAEEENAHTQPMPPPPRGLRRMLGAHV